MKQLFYRIQKFDQGISCWMIEHQHPLFGFFMKLISSLGNFGLIWLIIIFYDLLTKHTKEAGDLLLAIILATLLGQYLIKEIVRRLRPCQKDPHVKMIIDIPDDYSFPSGHTTSSFACATIIFLNHPTWGVLAYIFAGLMGFSRVYLYVHYCSDVLAGVVLGVLVGKFVFFL